MKVNYDEFKRIFVKVIFRSCLLALIKEIIKFNPFGDNKQASNSIQENDVLPVSVRSTTYQRTLLKKGISGGTASVKKLGRTILNSLADFKDFHHVYTDEELFEILNKRRKADTPSSLASDDFNYSVKKGIRFNI